MQKMYIFNKKIKIEKINIVYKNILKIVVA